MIESESTDTSDSENYYSNEDSDSNNKHNLPVHQALPWPDQTVDLPSNLKRKEKTSWQENTIQRNALPWNPNPGNSNPPKEINILLLGESGVGKSTFINSFANYMKHENFEAVQKNSLSVLIPARFHIFDKNFEEHIINIGANDENEHLSDGAAATQDVKTYVFYISIENTPYLIRLIDTPGMGDPRGIDQDNKNCDYVLNYLSRIEKVHAICLLLRPTNTRLDVFLNYCLTQVLSRLEKSATENIAFLFTNTRGQNYTPGETYTSLKLLVKKIKDTNNVALPLGVNNVFCFDNEAFRFLAAIKDGVEFKDGILEANIESWKYSYKEVYRLLSYIVDLKPHDPKKTIGINHARKMVLQLAQPLAEIVQLIGDNIYTLEQHTHQLLMENQTLDQLKQKLHMPVIDIKVKELTQPVTVCTASKCSSTYKVADKNKYHYKQRCHNPCYLNNVPAEIVGDPHILSCWAINKSTQTCHQCNCRFNTHMHIYYETDTFENKIVDKNVLKNINTKEVATKEKERFIDQILNRKEQLEKEHKYIIKCTAAFAQFLQKNAITPINDSLEVYVKYLITREENLGPNSNKITLDYLRRLLSEYQQEKSVIEEALKYDTATNGSFDNSPNAIEQRIRDLFSLPHFGSKIKQLYDLHQSGGLTEHKQSEFIVKEMYQLTVLDRVKSVGSSIAASLGFGSNKKSKKKQDQRQLMYQQDGSEYLYYLSKEGLRYYPDYYSHEQMRYLQEQNMYQNQNLIYINKHMECAIPGSKSIKNANTSKNNKKTDQKAIEYCVKSSNYYSALDNSGKTVDGIKKKRKGRKNKHKVIHSEKEYEEIKEIECILPEDTENVSKAGQTNKKKYNATKNIPINGGNQKHDIIQAGGRNKSNDQTKDNSKVAKSPKISVKFIDKNGNKIKSDEEVSDKKDKAGASKITQEDGNLDEKCADNEGDIKKIVKSRKYRK